MRLLLVLPLLLAGCSQTVVPVTDLRPIQNITSSCRDTKPTRDQVAQHNSRLDTLKTGKRVVYVDECRESAAKPTS